MIRAQKEILSEREGGNELSVLGYEAIFPKLQSDFLLSIDEFCNSVTSPKQFDDFSIFRKELTDYIYQCFEKHGLLDGKSSTFQKAFYQSNIGIFPNQETGKDMLMRYIFEKNIFYNMLLLKSLKIGKLENILKGSDSQTLIQVLESNILKIFDELYIGYRSHIPKLEDLPKDFDPNKAPFGGYRENKLVPYKSFIQREDFSSKNAIDSIENQYFRTSLGGIFELLSTGETDYDAWVENEGKGELQSWKDADSNIAMILPMETYEIKDRSIRPEIGVLLKYKHDTNVGSASELAYKYYGKDYGIQGINCYFAEPIIAGGSVAFSQGIGKNFPNDPILKARHGTFVYYKKSGFENIFNNALPYLEKLLGDINDIDKNTVKIYLDNHVEYHEYGHNLFIANNSTDLEETKPSLFHDLKLLDENDFQALSSDKIKGVVYFILVESMRQIERDGKENFFKYVLYTKLVISNLFESGLIGWDGDTLSIFPEPENYTSYLTSMKNVLDMIQSLYTMDTPGTRDLVEKEINTYIIQLDSKVSTNFEKMKKIMGV